MTGRRKRPARFREVGATTPTVSRERVTSGGEQPQSNRWQRTVWLFFIGLGLGLLIGAVGGWLLPLQDVQVGIDRLHPDYRADYAVMVGAAYSIDRDWDVAQARLGLLAEPDLAVYVARVTERYIAEARSPNDIRNLVSLAARLGYTTPAMQPYLAPSP